MSSNYHQEEPNISEELSTLDQESSETTSNSSRRLLSESQSHNRKPRVRCGECEPCLREDCGTCVYCLKKVSATIRISYMGSEFEVAGVFFSKVKNSKTTE